MTCWATLQTCALLCCFTEICLCYLSFLWNVTGSKDGLLNVTLYCCHVLQTCCSGWAPWCPSRQSGCLASPRGAVWGLAAGRRRKPVFIWSHWDLLSLFMERIGRRSLMGYDFFYGSMLTGFFILELFEVTCPWRRSMTYKASCNTLFNSHNTWHITAAPWKQPVRNLYTSLDGNGGKDRERVVVVLLFSLSGRWCFGI